MTTAKSNIVVLFVLTAVQIASAYYCPSTGRWLSRDPIGEPGFHVLQATTEMAHSGSPVFLQPSHWINRDPSQQSIGNFRAEDNEAIQDSQANPYNFVNNQPISQWDFLGLDVLAASGGSPHTSLIRHNNYLTFTINCPKCTEFTLVKIDYSGVIPGLITAGYSPSYIAGLGDLGGLRSNKTPNCRGDAVTLEAYMRSRLSFYGSGTPAYVAGTIIEYDCRPCSSLPGCCGPVLIP